MEETISKIPEQVFKAMDGRTQRWLALQVRMPETDMSKKLKGKMPFTDSELQSINEVLGSNITND